MKSTTWPTQSSLLDRIQTLEARVKVLEEENINTTNALYEIANSLEARIDILANVRNFNT